MPPYPTLLPACPQGGIVVEEWYCGTTEGDVMAPVTAIRVDGAQVPQSDCELGVGRKGAVVEGESKPVVPYAAILEVLVRRLRVDGQRLGVGEGLDGEVELGVGTEVAASMSQVGALEQGGVGEWLLVAFQSVSAIRLAFMRLATTSLY